MEMQSPIPVLRIFDEEKAREFYVDFLGFRVDWEHRFEENFPLYMQMSRGDCILHLSGHYGDACPGTALRIETSGLEDFRRDLLAKEYKHARPGIEDTTWGTREVQIHDPFGNRLIFFEATPR